MVHHDPVPVRPLSFLSGLTHSFILRLCSRNVHTQKPGNTSLLCSSSCNKEHMTWIGCGAWSLIGQKRPTEQADGGTPCVSACPVCWRSRVLHSIRHGSSRGSNFMKCLNKKKFPVFRNISRGSILSINQLLILRRAALNSPRGRGGSEGSEKDFLFLRLKPLDSARKQSLTWSSSERLAASFSNQPVSLYISFLTLVMEQREIQIYV